ncbi:helix-turn-helix domain-containing protein [Streptomyces sp. NPDC048340]|uniref:helix-turn-helix domain-containing protein n=1 Tax=Streptomyces sp. NPDC048340 TaxID=3365537 RepID=UPI003717684F
MGHEVDGIHTTAGQVLCEDHAAARISIERRHRKWSTTFLSDCLNHDGYLMNPSAVWRIENGKRRIHLDEAIGFARVFGIPLTELIGPPTLAPKAAELFEDVARAERAVQQAQQAHEQARDHLAAYLAEHPSVREEARALISG